MCRDGEKRGNSCVCSGGRPLIENKCECIDGDWDDLDEECKCRGDLTWIVS